MNQGTRRVFLPLLTLTVVADLLVNQASAHAASGSATSSNVVYHGGPVMADEMHAYAIFWEPEGSSVSSRYNRLLKRYLSDVGDSGLYENNQQYTDASDKLPQTPSSQARLWIRLPIHPPRSFRMPISGMKSRMR